MVKEDSHLYLAEEVLRQLKEKRIVALLKRKRAHYDLGAVIPDAFYYKKALARVSDIFHGKNGELSNTIPFLLLDKLRQKYDEATMAFVLGYLTHCAFDSVFHPVIYYFSGNYYDKDKQKRKQAAYLHRQLETALNQQLRSTKRFVEQNMPEAILETAFPAIISKAFGISENAVTKAARAQKKKNRLLRSKGGYLVLKALSRTGLWDWTTLSLSYHNLEQDKRALKEAFVFKNPYTGKETKETLKDLITKGIKRSVEYLHAAHAYVHGKMSKKAAMQIINGVSLETGHVGVSTQKLQYFAKSTEQPPFTNENNETHSMPWIHIPGYLWRRISPFRRAVRKREKWELPRAQPDLTATGDFLIWLGHAGFLLKIAGKWLAIDPELTTPFGILRLAAPALTPKEMPELDYLLISHGHKDHLDKRTIEGLKVKEALLPLRMGTLLQRMKKGLTVKEAGWHETYNLKEEFTITFLPALHYHRRNLFDANTMLWGSFLIEWRKKKLFFCGDSGYAKHFKEIGKRYGPIDYCIMPIAAYAPSWLEGKSHMTPKESLMAFKDLKGKTFIPMHYGTFDLSDEPMAEPLELLKKAQKKERIRILKIGENLPL